MDALLLSAWMAVNVADFRQTIAALDARTVVTREANIAFRPLVDHPVAFGVVKLGAAAGVGLALTHATPQHPKLARVALAGLTAAVGAAAVHNAHVARR